MSLYPQASQIAKPSEPNSHLTRLLTASEILLNAVTSISVVLSVTVISPPFRFRLLNLHQNCLVDTIFILYQVNMLGYNHSTTSTHMSDVACNVIIIGKNHFGPTHCSIGTLIKTSQSTHNIFSFGVNEREPFLTLSTTIIQI
jgi:hypothetical protein